MRRFSTIAFVGILALTIGGCGTGNEESNDRSALLLNTTQPAKQPAKAFENQPPMVPPNPVVPISPAPGLIQPTNPNQRAKQVQKGRQDPFAGLFVPSVLKVPTTATPPKNVTEPPSRSVAPAPQRVAVRTIPPRPVLPPPRVVPGSSQPTPSPSVTPSPSQAPRLPTVAPDTSFLPSPAQDPDLARAVTVTGVVQVGSQPQAIVKVPNEATSRYVRVGQRLSNGQVLVKRIEINEGSDPVVILEQYGVEVARAVGEESGNRAQTATPTAGAIPAPPPPDNSQQIDTPTDGSSAPPPPPDNSQQIDTPTDAAPAPPSPNNPAQIDTPTDAAPAPPSSDNAPSPGG